jgi:hypothetical protein
LYLFQANTDEASKRDARNVPLYNRLLGSGFPYGSEQLLLPAVTEVSALQYGDFSGYFPGSYLNNRFPGQWQQYGHNYPSYAGFEGPYSTEYVDLLGQYGLPAQYAYPKQFGLPAVVEKTEEIVIEKPISTGFFGYQNNFGFSPLVKETEEIVIENPISTGFYGYPGYYGHQSNFGFSPLVKETEEILIEKPISTGFYGYPGYYGYQNNFGFSPLVKETEEIVIEKPISTGFYGYPNHFGY